MHDSRTFRLLLLCVTLIGAHADLVTAQEPLLSTTPMLECSGHGLTFDFHAHRFWMG